MNYNEKQGKSFRFSHLWRFCLKNGLNNCSNSFPLLLSVNSLISCWSFRAVLYPLHIPSKPYPDFERFFFGPINNTDLKLHCQVKLTTGSKITICFSFPSGTNRITVLNIEISASNCQVRASIPKLNPVFLRHIKGEKAYSLVLLPAKSSHVFSLP